MTVTLALAVFAGGFSLGAALLLVFAFASIYRGLVLPWHARVAGYVMLLGLGMTQYQHVLFLLNLSVTLVTRSYALVMFAQSLGFYYLLLGVLRPAQQKWFIAEWAILLAGCVGGFLVPLEHSVSLTMLMGTAAAAHLGWLVFRLKAQRRWFVLELRVLALFAAMAISIAAISFSAQLMGWTHFAAAYTALIGASFGLVLYLLLRFPDIASRTQDAVATAYAVSTLSSVDTARHVTEVKRLFETEKIYVDEHLSLAKLAELTQLSTHQLSELINTQFQMGFSRLVRKYRVEAAQKMLLDEPRASVLSVGFTSQSNFYVAFKEFSGTVPSQYRKQSTPKKASQTPQ